MPVMLRTVRLLLVLTVAFATVLAGLRESLSGCGADHDGTCAIEAGGSYAAGDDDSGTRAEEVEEDDGDEKEGRDIHLFATAPAGHRAEASGHSAWSTPPAGCGRRSCRATFVRGPPAIG